MIRLTSGNLLDAGAEALVNTVNCVGVMGKGIALQIKQRVPAGVCRLRTRVPARRSPTGPRVHG